MLKVFGKSRIEIMFFVVVTASVCWAGQQLDKTKYITVDEIKPGMEAYCLTTYKSTEIEKFGLEVLSVVRDITPGRDAILVQGTDERFIHTGPVAGCSGSPVYIEGRLAGALAFGWANSKDPLYGVTPIEEMLNVGQVSYSEEPTSQMAFRFDFSRPIDFAEIDRQITAGLFAAKSLSMANALPCPLITSGLPMAICEQLDDSVGPLGFMAVSGVGGGTAFSKSSQNSSLSEDASKGKDVALVPGASLAVPLVTGDIPMTAVGTVTEVVGDKVYGFGHSFLGYGQIELPMATGEVHTVVSSVTRSFKFATAIETVGALKVDEATAVQGQVGAKARMIPLTITVNRYNDAEKRVYNCQVANNRLLTPLMVRAAVGGAALMLGDLPPDNTVEYNVTIDIEGSESITFKNVSTDVGVSEMILESTGSLAMLLNNPYKKVDIKSISFDVSIAPKSITSHIWSVDLSDSKVKAGQSIDVSVVLESVLMGKKEYKYSLMVPEELAAGTYEVIVCGYDEYNQFLMKAAPYKFVPENLRRLIKVINEVLAMGRDKLYCLLVLPSGGITVESSELPDLPATKALVLDNDKRTLRTQPYARWIEKSLSTGTVVIDKKVMRITVEE